MTREEERALIDRVLSGETDAFEPLVAENQKQVYHLALRMLENPEDASDAAQEVFLRAYRSLDSFRAESRFSVWLYRLTSNICIDMLRAQRRRQTFSLSVGEEEGEVQELEIPDRRFSPETALERAQLREAVRQGLDKLALEYREVLVLREIQGLSYEEIGQVLGLETGTVKSRLFRGRQKLCKILLEDGNISGFPPSNIQEKGV